jgi:hypothetical protein
MDSAVIFLSMQQRCAPARSTATLDAARMLESLLDVDSTMASSQQHLVRDYQIVGAGTEKEPREK